MVRKEVHGKVEKCDSIDIQNERWGGMEKAVAEL